MEQLTPQKTHVDIQTQQYDDEIDLKELFVSLWEGKFIIALVSLAFSLVAVAYSLLASEKWEATAKITQPELSQYKALQIQISQFQPIFNELASNGEIHRSIKLDQFDAPDLLVSTFVQQFNNRENKKEYLETNLHFTKSFNALKKVDDVELNKINEQKLFHAWYKKLSIKKSAKAKNDQSHETYELIAQSNTAQSSYDLLLGYLALVNDKSQRVIQKNFNSLVNGKRNQLKQEINIFKEQARSRLLVEKLKSKYELNIAQSAGVSRPLENYEAQSESVFSIALGADALTAKLKVLEGLDNLSLFEPMIAQHEAKLNLLNDLRINPNIQFQVMQFVELPEKPYERSAPNRKLFTILGAVLGAGLGVVVVLVGVAFRKRENAKA